jgi:hypothetical protein
MSMMNSQKEPSEDDILIADEPMEPIRSKGISSIFSMKTSNTNTNNSSQEQPSSYSYLTKSAGVATFIQYGVIIIIISLLGLNVFGFLGNIIENITEMIVPIAAFFGYTVGETIKGAVSTSATGTKGLIDAASGTITGGVEILEKGLDKKIRNNRNKIDNSFLDQSVPNNEKPDESPEPDESGSRTQMKSTGKSGYCYIGEDRGFRNCIEVGENDKCMSGDIFPSREICINPNLRE